MTRYFMHTQAFEEVQNSAYYVGKLGYKDLVEQLQAVTTELLRRRNEEELAE